MWEPPNTIHMLMQFKNEETDRSVHMEHIMTPETETSAHYFLNWTRDFTLNDEAYPTDYDVRSAHTLVDGLAAGIVDTDDIPMMEAIQKNLDILGDVKDVAIPADVFVVSAHRVLTAEHKKVGNVVPRECGGSKGWSLRRQKKNWQQRNDVDLTV